MKKHKFVHVLIFYIIFLWIGSGVKYSFSQVKNTINISQDDPILAALDSLNMLTLFEKGYAKIKYPINFKYHFSIDSVPKYDDMVYEARLARLDALSPFDLQYNIYVQNYIDMYTLRRRELVSRVMALSQLYFPMFEQILDKYNLPLELKYLAICESALNPLAKSKSAAMGLWQFMYPTGKMFGLNVSSYIDERCDPYKSTIAACEYFKYLFQLFGDWQLVLAAYNGGPGTVSKAIRRSGGKKTFWEIRPFLPKETQGYVPAFIAVNYVMNYTSEHNFRSAIPKKTFLEVDTIRIIKQLSFDRIAFLLNISEDELRYLNPIYRKGVIPVSPEDPSFLTLPSNKIALFMNNENLIYNYPKQEISSSNNLNVRKETKIHIVKKGEGLISIAKKYGCTVSDIKTWNVITANTINPGRKLNIYFDQKNSENTEITEGSNKKAISSKTIISNIIANKGKQTNNFKYYTIKKGDSLYKIAQKHNTTIDEIKQLNKLGVNYNLLPGKQIIVAAF